MSIVIFGASGDLTRRKLAPALYRLHEKGRLPEALRIVGFARTEFDDASFREFVRDALDEFERHPDGADREQFLSTLHYVEGDLADADAYRALGRRLEELEGGPADRLYYLAIAPRFFPVTVDCLGRAGMERQGTGRRNLVIEKPFGRDGTSARELDAAVHAVFDEGQVYRIDHYLGKETAQNLLYFRFANTIFEAVWNRHHVDNVQITVAESVGVGHRAGYYDQAGVLRDMFQNHLLQLFTLVAMEPPAPYNARTLRDEKAKVLCATRPISLDDTVCARYDGYLDAPDVSPDSRTPTFAALKLYVDNWRWQDIPFYLRSGKAMAEKTSSVTLEFKRPPHEMLRAFDCPGPNVLSLCVQPDEGVHLTFHAKVPDRPRETGPVDLEFHYRTSFPDVSLPDAYERLLLDALASDASLFARSDEIENAWRLMDPVIERWEAPSAPEPARYACGSWGPEEADELLRRDGRRWWMGCRNHG